MNNLGGGLARVSGVFKFRAEMAVLLRVRFRNVVGVVRGVGWKNAGSIRGEIWLILDIKITSIV